MCKNEVLAKIYCFTVGLCLIEVDMASVAE